MNNNYNNNNRQRNAGGQSPNYNGAGRPYPNGGNQPRAPYQQNMRATYPPVRHRSRKQARRAALVTVLFAAIVVMLLISVIIFAARCASGFGGPVDTSDTTTDAYTNGAAVGTGDAPTVTEPVVTEPPETELDAAYEYVAKTAADIHRGYQILVNYQNAYTFDGGFSFNTLFSSKNGCFKVSNTTDSLDTAALRAFCAMTADMANSEALVDEVTQKMDDIIVTSSDRTYEFQEQLYGARVDQYGEEYAGLYVAMPGHSEHHTGLALDLAIYTDAGHAFTFDTVTEYPTWLKANAHKYGFIERYQADKTAITKIAYENWHYRYIGKPHAYIMNANSWCLEEYIDELRKFTFEGKRLAITDDEGTAWEIYFVPANAAEDTRIPVPKHNEWEISGNNVDGFIVTVKK